MVQNYNLNQKLLACILLLGLFLQSCNSFPNQLIPQEKEPTDDKYETTEHVGISPLVDKELIVEKGYLVKFHEQEGKLQANVRVDGKQPKPNYTNLLVELEKGVDLAELPKLSPKIQQGRIQLHRTQSGQPDRVIVSKGGLRGGMMEGDQNQKEKEPEKGARVENLLERAKNGEVEAQYQLGKKAYDFWEIERVEERKSAYEKEARKWLGLAATNKDSRAVKLLEILNKHRFEPPLQSTDNNFLRDRNRKEERKEKKTSQDILRISDIKELRKYFYKGYLEIIPKNCEQLIKFSKKYETSFESYEGGLFVKGWETATDLASLIDLLVLFSKIKKFEINCVREDEAELVEVIGRAIQFYEELTELNLSGCQLSDAMMQDILESMPSPEKLRILDVNNNELSTEMLARLQEQFPNAQLKSNLEGSSQNSSQLREKGKARESGEKADFETVVLEQEGSAYIGEKENKYGKEKKKGSEESLRIPSSISGAKSLNGLPPIGYDYPALLAVMNKIPMGLEGKEQAVRYLENIQTKVKEIKDYQSNEYTKHFYYPMKEAVLEIRDTSGSLYELTNHYHDTLSHTLRTMILESISSFEKELNKRLEMPVEEEGALRTKTKRLYAEQSYIARQGEIQKKLMAHLGKLKQLLTEVGKPSPRCYISYAWPSKEHKQEEYWIQPFLSILYDHLRAAGIRVIMDIRDNKPGDSIYKFMERYHDGNYVILVGTESLLQKHYSITPHAVQTELSIILDRFEQDQKQYGYSRICPLLISGTMKTSFPEIYDKYRTVRDGREMGYVLMLRRLVDWICKRQIIKIETEYENLWRAFDVNCSGLPKDSQVIEEELSIGYHRQRLDYLKQDLQFQTVQAQEETKHSSAVSAQMIGVLMESQGNNPKLLYSEYGQQFQRPSITPDFIERQELWEKIVAHFKQFELQILTLSAHGLGGMGKTELAKYYYLCSPRPYALRAWFNAENRELLYTQYVDLAKSNGIEYEDKIPVSEQAKQVKSWLETRKDCLLVYDNVPDAKQLEGLLPEQGKHHILITSRNAVEWPAHQKLDVDVMEEHEAIALICKITGYKEETIGIEELVSTLGYMPLALAQAGAYITQKQTSIVDYLRRYHKHQSILMSAKTLTGNPKHDPVWITFDMNFKALEEDCPNALITLNQVSWLAASVIPELLLETMLDDTQDKSLELLWDEVKEHIGRYSLMRIDRENHRLSMHPLLQDILRSKQDILERKRILHQIALSIKRIYPKNAKTTKDIALVRLLVPHMERVLASLKEFFNEHEWSDSSLEFNLGNAYETVGNYIKAKENYHVDLLIKQKKYIGNHPDVSTSLDHLGWVYNKLSESEEALKYYQQALEMMRALYSGNHPDIVKSLNNIGNVYYSLDQFQEAFKCYEQALEMRQALYTDHYAYIATSVNNIGGVYHILGKNQEALKYYQQALEMQQDLYIDNHPDIATSPNNIGDVYKDLGQNKEALKYHEQALKMNKNLYTGNHPDIANSLNNLGAVYQALGQYREALKYLKQALEVRRTLYPGNHTDIASSLDNIGSVYQALGQPQEALRYYEPALAMRQALYGGNHPDVAISFNNIGTVYQALEQNQEALKYFEQALEMRKALYTGNHPDIAQSLHNVGNLYRVLGQLQEALRCLKQALEMRQALYSGNHPDIANSFDSIGSVYFSLGQFQEALNYYEQALEMFKALHPDNPNHPAIQMLRRNTAQQLAIFLNSIYPVVPALVIGEGQFGDKYVYQ